MKLYRIKNWSANYENNRTREMKTMSWVPLPINLHGSGYVALMSKKNGPAMFGTWCALLELAATCEIRGTFSRGRGIPHTISTISSQLRIPEKLVAATLELLESEEIDWVESIESDVYKQNPAPLPQAHCGETAVKLRDDCGKTAVSGRKEGIEGTVKQVIDFPSKTKPQTSEADSDEEILEIASRIKKRHPQPQKMTEEEIIRQFISIQKPTETLLELARLVDGNHVALCRLDESLGGWKGKNPQFIPTLRKWLATSARDPTEQPVLPTFQDLKAQEWIG